MHVGSHLIKLSFCAIFLTNLFSVQCLSNKHKLLFTYRFLHAKPTLLAKILRKYLAGGVYFFRFQISKSARSFYFCLWTPSPSFCQSLSACPWLLVRWSVVSVSTQTPAAHPQGWVKQGTVWLGFSASKLNPSEIEVLLSSISLAIFLQFAFISYLSKDFFFFFTHCKYFILGSLKYCQLEAATEQ